MKKMHEEYKICSRCGNKVWKLVYANNGEKVCRNCNRKELGIEPLNSP